jgi:pimeloyl-ACP methyl ester carboxylesterase
VLHHDVGNRDWLPFHEQLAAGFDVLAPDMPGYGASERPEWARHPRDQAILMLQLLDHLEIDKLTLVGLGFGGWVAAEMATMSQRRFDSMVLVAPMGIQPKEGEFLDQIMVSHITYARDGFRNRQEFEKHFGAEVSPEQALFWDLNKEMTARISWKPYMFSRQLPHLLRGVKTPTLLVWGAEDKVVPLECGDLYRQALATARLEVIAETGHLVEMERPRELATLISNIAKQS